MYLDTVELSNMSQQYAVSLWRDEFIMPLGNILPLRPSQPQGYFQPQERNSLTGHILLLYRVLVHFCRRIVLNSPMGPNSPTGSSQPQECNQPQGHSQSQGRSTPNGHNIADCYAYFLFLFYSITINYVLYVKFSIILQSYQKQL